MITLNTIAYEGNFIKLLVKDSWFFKFNSKFITKKTITINNVYSKEVLKNRIDELKQHYNFDLVYVSEEEETAKKDFNLNINKETLGYHYTIPYFVAINNTKTDYLLNVATDCMDDIFINDTFLICAINEIEGNPRCSSTMVAWTKNNYIMKSGMKVGEFEEFDIFKKHEMKGVLSDNFHYTLNFTDQFFMNSIDKLKKIDYNINENEANKIYNGPAYGGNSFEKRMVGHQVKNNVYNCVFKGDNFYIHDNNYY